MFGKKRHKTSNEKFIIGKGIDAGNLKGRGARPQSAPTHKGTSLNSLNFPGPKGSGTENYSVIRRGKS